MTSHSPALRNNTISHPKPSRVKVQLLCPELTHCALQWQGSNKSSGARRHATTFCYNRCLRLNCPKHYRRVIWPPLLWWHLLRGSRSVSNKAPQQQQWQPACRHVSSDFARRIYKATLSL